jgi:hypothetical protein
MARYTPGQDRYLIVSMREGLPERKRFYTIEQLGDGRSKEIAFFPRKGTRDQVLHLLQMIEQFPNGITSCAFCGAIYPQGTPRHGDGALIEHIKVCPQHPMREAEAERDQLAMLVQGALDAWDGAVDTAKLWQRMCAWARQARPEGPDKQATWTLT